MPKATPVIPAGVEINGAKVRILRKLSGQSMADLAQRCEVTPGYVSHIETGRRKRVSPTKFVLICDALGIPADERASMQTPAAQRRIKAAA